MDQELRQKIRAEVHSVVDERAAERDEEVRKIVRQSVAETLVRLGLDAGDPFEIQRDMQYVRRWRTASETIQRRTVLTAITLFVTGALGMLWLGVQQVLGKH